MPFLLILLLSLGASRANAGGWEQVYGDTGMDEARCIQVTADHGFIVAGATTAPEGFPQKAWVLKLDSWGDTVWTRTYTNGRYAEIHSILPLADGGYLAAGAIDGLISDAWVLRLDASGDTVWTHTYGGANHETAYGLTLCADGNYLFGGLTQSSGAGGADGWLVKINDTGDMLWEHTYGGTGSDQIRSIVTLPEGGFLAVGTTNSHGAGEFDAWMLKLTNDGDTVWTRTLGGFLTDMALSAAVSADGNYVVAGSQFSQGMNGQDAWVAKLTPAGMPIWSRTYTGSGADQASYILPLADSEFVVAGYTSSSGAGLRDAWIFGLNSSGTMTWSRTYGGGQDDEALAVAPTHEGMFLAAGYTYSMGAGDKDLYLIKLDSLGAGLSVEPSTDGTPLLGNMDAAYRAGRLELRLSLLQPMQAHLELFNPTGTRIAVLYDGALPLGESYLTPACPVLAAGVYFIAADGRLPGTKLLVLK